MKVRQKGKMDRTKKPMEPLDLGKEELTLGIEEIDVEEDKSITQLPPYICRGNIQPRFLKTIFVEVHGLHTVATGKSTF